MAHYSKKKEIRERFVRRDMLSEWYGEDIANVEIIAHSPQPESIASCLERVCSKVFDISVQQRIELSNNWKTVVGEQLAVLTTPSCFNEGVLELEVRHAAFLRELDGTKDIIILKVNQFFKIENLCKDIRFVPAS